MRGRRAFRAGLLLFLLVALAGCTTEERKAGRRAGFAAGRTAGEAEGREAGAAEGTASGVELAERRAAAGTLPAIYVEPALISLLLAFVLGLVLQYSVLSYISRQRRFRQGGIAWLVPGLVESRTYRLLTDLHRRLFQLAVRTRADLQQLQARETSARRRLEAAQSLHRERVERATQLQELLGSRLVALAHQEFDSILKSAEEDLRREPRPRRPSQPSRRHDL